MLQHSPTGQYALGPHLEVYGFARRVAVEGIAGQLTTTLLLAIHSY